MSVLVVRAAVSGTIVTPRPQPTSAICEAIEWAR